MSPSVAITRLISKPVIDFKSSNAKIFKCPCDKITSEIKDEKLGIRISYIYIKGLTEKNSSDSIIAYDASPDYHDGNVRNVLFLDGHVVKYAEKEFQKLFNKNRE